MMEFVYKDIKTSIFMFCTLKEVNEKLYIIRIEIKNVKKTKWKF